MRRAIVVFLILLFPLHLAALCLSVATLHADGLDPVVASVDADGGHAADDDIDPDEPPSSAEHHDAVKDGVRPAPAAASGAAAFAHLLAPPGLGPLPPIKPPPVA